MGLIPLIATGEGFISVQYEREQSFFTSLRQKTRQDRAGRGGVDMNAAHTHSYLAGSFRGGLAAAAELTNHTLVTIVALSFSSCPLPVSFPKVLSCRGGDL